MDLSFNAVRIAIFQLLLFVCPDLSASNLVIDSQFESTNLAPYADYYEAISRSETIEDIKQLSETNWQRVTEDTLSFSITDSSYWVRFKLESLTTSELLLEIEKAGLDQVEIYIIKGDSTLYSRSGDKTLYLNHPYPLLPVSVTPDNEVTIYLKAADAGAFHSPVKLWETEFFYESYAGKQLLRGSYLGIWISILLANLALFFVSRHRLLASFSGWIFSFGICGIFTLGIAGKQLWINNPGLTDAIPIISFGVGLIFLCDFASMLLNLGCKHRAGERTLQVLAALCLITVLGYFLLPTHTIELALTILTIPVSGTILLLGVIHTVNGSRIALYATAAWSLLLAGMIAGSLTSLGYIPSNEIIGTTVPAGFFLMTMALTFIIARDVMAGATTSDNMENSPGLVTTGSENSSIRKRPGPVLRPVLESALSNRTRELETALEELSQANDTLREYNTIDSLTGVKNRRFFDSNYEQEWRRAVREKYPLSLILIDVDHFKSINDRFGHLAGDECLKRVAKSISSVIKRPGDILARYGGEEFVIVLPYITNENACLLANEIHKRVKSMTLKINDKDINVTISIGVCSAAPTDSCNSKNLISQADSALYDAKHSGRDQIYNAGEMTAGTSHALSHS